MSERKVGFPPELAAPYDRFFVVDYADLEARIFASMTEGEIEKMISEGSPVKFPEDYTAKSYHYVPGSHKGYTGPGGGHGYHRAGESVKVTGSFTGRTTEQDEVVYGGYRRAKIEKYLTDGRVTVRFVEKDMIPPTMDVRCDDLKWAWGGPVVNPHTHCPKCKIAWKSTMMFQFPRFDCPSCGAKKEDHAP